MSKSAFQLTRDKQTRRGKRKVIAYLKTTLEESDTTKLYDYFQADDLRLAKYKLILQSHRYQLYVLKKSLMKHYICLKALQNLWLIKICTLNDTQHRPLSGTTCSPQCIRQIVTTEVSLQHITNNKNFSTIEKPLRVVKDKDAINNPTNT